jgi:hypothetical protein
MELDARSAPKRLAHSLIAVHGDDAIGVAEKALANVRSLTMQAPTAQWLKVIEAIKTAQAGTAASA